MKFCTNSFHWVPTDYTGIFDMIRFYVDTNWINETKGLYKFQPAYSARGEFDNYLTKLKSLNIEPVFCLHNCPKWLQTEQGINDQEAAPSIPGMSRTDPAAYRHFAEACFQIAARYGQTTHPNSALKVDESERWTNEGKNAVISGLKLLRYIEVWNEPNKFWRGNSPANMTPQEYAAMLSACYDGHEGKLGAGYGIKTADRQMQVVMGGLAGLNSDYLLAMGKWFSENRTDKKFAADVMNAHHYCNEDPYGVNIRGASPEADGLRFRLAGFKKNCEIVAKDTPLWLTEFGYDTDPGSPQYVHENEQGKLLVRSFHEGAASGISAMFIYNSNDEPNPKAGLYTSSGFLYGESKTPQYSPKVAYPVLATMIRNLKGKTLKGESIAGDGTRVQLWGDNAGAVVCRWNPNAKTVKSVVRYAPMG